MSSIAVVEVLPPPPLVIDVALMQGPPGAAGAPGPAGPAGPAGPEGPPGEGGGVPTDQITLSNYIAVGTNPAQSGAIRLANNQPIMARTAANSADVALIHFASYGQTILGQDGIYTSHHGISFFSNRIELNSYLNIGEVAVPPTPPADSATLWVQDNGAGKSQLMIKFATGAAIQIAIQP